MIIFKIMNMKIFNKYFTKFHLFEVDPKAIGNSRLSLD